MDPILSSSILAASIALQVAAAVVALRHIRLTGRAAGWVCIAVAVSLMAVRRVITLVRYLSTDTGRAPDPIAESVALLISILMLFGIVWLGNVLRARNLAEQERRDYEERFAAAFRLAPSMMMLTTLDDGRIVEVNRAFEISTGYDAQDVYGVPEASLGIWQDQGLRARVVAQLEAHGRIEPTESMLVDQTGRELTVLLSGERLQVAERPMALWQAIDISERKRNELELWQHRNDLESLVAERTESLRESMAKLAESERLASIGTLAAGVAHQINNPIGAILLATQYALMSEGQPDERSVWREALARIDTEARRGGRIVRSVLRFARNEQAERWEEDLGELVQRAIDATSRYAEERQAHVELRAPAEPVRVVMSPIEIEEVVVNLIRNAIESQPAETHVQITVGGDEEKCWVSVEDDGPGIPASHAKRLFEPFFTTRLREGGSGLGLSIAQGMIQAHGGEISAEPNPTGGTRIHFDLPRRGDVDTEPDAGVGA